MVPESGDLSAWTERGVLLLNTALTVEQGRPASHAKWGRDSFVLDVCRVCLALPQPIVFLLWGGMDEWIKYKVEKLKNRQGAEAPRLEHLKKGS